MSALDKFYRNLFQLSPQPMWVYDVHTLKFLDVNDAAIIHYGYSKAEFMSMTIRQIRPKEDLKKFDQAIREVKLRRPQHKKSVSRHTKKNGEVIDVEVHSNLIETGHNLGEIVVVNDITEMLGTQKALIKARQDMVKSERRFKALIQNGSDLTSILDESGIYQFVSESVQHLLGIAPEKMQGINVLNYVHPEDRERVYKEMLTLYEVKRVSIGPFRFLDGKKNWRWLCTTATNMLDDPDISGIITNSRDVTDEVTSNNELKLSNDRYKILLDTQTESLKKIKEQNEKLKEIAWTQSHQVRAQITRIMALSELLKQENLSPDQQQLAEFLHQSASELDDVIKNIIKGSTTAD